MEVLLAPAEAKALMKEEVRAGLAGHPRELPSKYFYDERGVALFDEITRLPEYYLTRAEEALLARNAEEILALARPRQLVELGPGSAGKTGYLVESGMRLGALARYVPVEVSREAAEAGARRLAGRYPSLSIHALVGDFERHLDRVPPAGPTLVAFLGSTIGNFLRPRAERLLARIGSLLGEDGFFLLGTDLVKERRVLEAAYNDARGVTAEFNRNLLRVVNRELEADFVPEAFDHLAFYDEAGERIEMHLRSRRPQQVRLASLGIEVALGAGETIRTEVSCKYTRASVESALAAAGLEVVRWYEGDGFALSVSRRAGDARRR